MRSGRLLLIKKIVFLSTLTILFCMTTLKTWSTYRELFPYQEGIEQAMLNLKLGNLSYKSQRRPGRLNSSLREERPMVRQSVVLADSNFTYLLNLSQYQLEFPYLQSYYCFLLIDQPGFCQQSCGKPLVLLAIKSQPESFQRRAAIRQTWAQVWEIGNVVVKPVFLMAMSNNSGHNGQVVEEDSEHKDILLWDFEESHHNLSLKERCFIDWLYYSCQEAEFIFKGDDDEFVNPKTVVRYVSDFVNSSTTVHGHLMVHSDVMREGKYQISKTLYPLKKYPTFLSGGGFIIPGDSIPALHNASTLLPVFPLDDVYFGFLMLAANLTYRHDARFCVSRSKQENCLFLETLVVHGLSPATLLSIWKGSQSFWNWTVLGAFLLLSLVAATLSCIKVLKRCYNGLLRVLVILPSSRTYCRLLA
ncbi:N-acetyllactosaminide beta-1,3-N-acetylglucosaminyltransferase 2-like [Rhinatrema bivittatum]|uniref:N-acetyllactosaminide beta-1,3-N-acetylglucosaminyltransferase 2-like n=1 Tax=Rhinatrema bivittatum TaxID=194408 RepID=UPI001125B6F8|nr:N-acetyllactosaminide beta-1,3-N-acetylglucosaminyltransferase 2-like [Rhinatrema bivittatum]